MSVVPKQLDINDVECGYSNDSILQPPARCIVNILPTLKFVAVVAFGVIGTLCVRSLVIGADVDASVEAPARALEENDILMNSLGGIIWLGFAILCCGIQYIAYRRSRFEPHPLPEGVQQELSGEDIYGEQLELKQLWKAKELCGCEAKNRYMSKDEKYFIDETSDTCQRLCASSNRELTLWGHSGNDTKAPIVTRMYKPYHLQGGCCFCRPRMEIALANGSKVGSIEDPFKCCTMDQQIMDKAGAVRFTTTGSICQCGICCPCCADVSFDINDKSGNRAGGITKPALTCQEMCVKTNRFVVDFPKQSTMEDKHLLVGSAMLLDLQYFEKNKNDN